jgi:hypothetical protein
MVYVLLVFVGIPLFALVFSVTVCFLGLFWNDFQTTGPGGFKMLYGKMLIIAAMYVLLSMAGIGGLIGLAIMAFGYKIVFAAGWLQAFVVGLLGGVVGWVLFLLVAVALSEMGLPLA